jgi:hypothetical protein
VPRHPSRERERERERERDGGSKDKCSPEGRRERYIKRESMGELLGGRERERESIDKPGKCGRALSHGQT